MQQQHHHLKLAFYLFGVLCLGASLTLVGALTDTQMRNWAQSLGQKYNSVARDILGTEVYEQFLQDEHADSNRIREITRDGNDGVEDFAASLSAIVKQKDDIIKEMQKEMERVISDYVRDDNTGRPQFIDSTDPNDLSQLNLQNHRNFPEKVDPDNSVIRFAPGVTADDDDNQQVRDHLFISQDLEPIFRKYLDDTTWQYFGSQTGFYRQYPGREWTKDSSGRYTEFDARLRPWYVGSTSGPKDVLILFDISGSMSVDNRMSIGRGAIMTVLDTLTERDFVNVILFDSRVEVPDCFPNTLVRAIPRNIQRLKDFVNSFNPRGGTDFRIAFEKAFEILRESRSEGLASFCETVILFMTDGIANDPSDIIAANEDPDMPVAVFSYAFGNDADVDVPQKIACENNGLFFNIPDGGDLRTSMGNYYQYFATGMQNTDVFWTAPYFDASGLGLVVTASVPLYDRRVDPPSLFGVVGTDVVVSELLLEAYSVSDDSSYAFVINREGQTLAHPLLKPPTDYNSPPVYIDIGELEQYQDFATIRKDMMEGNSGSVRDVQITRNIPAGDVEHEGVRQRSYRASYYYRPIPDSDFSVALVLAINDEDGYEFRDPGAKSYGGSSLYHRVDQYNAGFSVDTLPAPSSSNRGPVYYTTDSSTYKIAPRGFSDPYQYENLRETTETSKDLNEYVNGEGSGGELLPRDLVLTDIRMTRSIESHWKSSYNETSVLWMYVGTQNGIWRAYPGHNTTQNYDPVNRPWYLRAVASRDSGVTLSTPYQDASNPDARVVTISKPILAPDTDNIHSVLGLDFLYEEFSAELRRVIPECSINDNSHRCFLVDQAGMLVVHAEFDRAKVGESVANTFMGENSRYRLNDVVEKLIEIDSLERKEYIDMQTLQKIVYYNFDTSSDYAYVSDINGCFGSNTYGVAAVPDTNLYLIVAQDQGSAQDGCTDVEPSQEPLDICTLTETASFESCPSFSLTTAQLENLRDGSCAGFDGSSSDASPIATVTPMTMTMVVMMILFFVNISA